MGSSSPFLTQFSVTDDPNDTFDFNFGDRTSRSSTCYEAPAGSDRRCSSRCTTQYNDQPDHDLDLYVFYCPDFACTQVGSSADGTSDGDGEGAVAA